MKNEKVRVMSEDWPVKSEALPHQSEDWTLSFELFDLHCMFDEFFLLHGLLLIGNLLELAFKISYFIST